MIVTNFEKAEWSRMATKAYAKMKNATGTRMSVAASIPAGAELPVETYDTLMSAYRAWLVFDEYVFDEGEG